MGIPLIGGRSQGEVDQGPWLFRAQVWLITVASSTYSFVAQQQFWFSIYVGLSPVASLLPRRKNLIGLVRYYSEWAILLGRAIVPDHFIATWHSQVAAHRV